MKTHRFRLAAALTAAMIVLTALTGCMTGPRKPSSPAESAVTVDGEIRGLFIHATGQDLIIQSPYDAGTVAQSLDQIMSYAAENGINTVFMDVHDAKGSALYTSDYMPTSELMLDEKGKNSGGDIVYEAVRAAKKQNIQVYAVINTTYIAESLGIASEDHPAVYDSSLSYEDGNGALRWNTSKKDSMSTLTNIARELCYNYGISGLVLNDDGTDPQTMAKVFSTIDQAVDELGTGKKIGVYTQITPQGLESGNNALNAFSEEGYAPDFLLADLQGTTVSGDYTQLLNDVSAATEGRCDLITVHNMNLISADSGADGKLYADPYEPAYQIYENRGHSIRGTAIEGYSALRSSKYYLMDLMNSLYDSNYDICPYELTVEPGFGSTLQSDTFTTSSAKYFISVISDPDQLLYLNGSEVTRTTKNGLYGQLVSLSYGENEFVFTQGDESVTITIARPEPTSTGDSTISRIAQTSMYPSAISAARVGEELTISCVAPSGSTVYASVLGQQVQLKQAVATAKNGIAATYTADLIFDAPIDSNEVKNMGNVTYTLVYGGTTTTYTSSGELYAVGENAQLIMQVTDYMSGVTVDDSSENAGNFLTTLIEGSQDYVDLSKSSTTHFYLQSGGAIRKETVTLLEGKDLSIDTTIGTTDTVKVDKGDEFVIPGAAGTLWHANFADNKLVLDLYNIEDGALPTADGSKFTLASTMTSDGIVQLTVTPKDGVTFWGYDVTYDGEDLVLYCKQKPQISASSDKPLEGISIVIDPGHGGYDPGSLGAAYGYGPTEDEINMAYAVATEQILEGLGADVTLTLYPDQLDDQEEKLVLFDRMKIAKEADADVFISMHHNSVDATADANNVTGLEVYYFTDHSEALAADIAASISASTGRTNRGDFQSYYVVTKMTYCPAVLTEIGYIVNPAEYEDLIQPETIFRTAASFTKSILDVLS